MHPEQEHVPAVPRLLALKRHEQPPPGYFDRFSGQVIARIRAGERAPDSWWERLAVDVSWLQRLWAAFETKPLLAGAFGVTVCGLVTAGFLFSDRSSEFQSAPLTVFIPAGHSPSGLQMAAPATSPLFGQVPGLETSPTGSVDGVQVRASLFQDSKPQSRLVNFSLPGGN